MLHDPTLQEGQDAERLEAETVVFFDAIQQAAASRQDEVRIGYGSLAFTVKLPPLGEGDRALVYSIQSASLNLPEARGQLCLKVAKQQQICRDCLLEESDTTDYYLSEGIKVPRIYYMDSLGRYSIKEFIDGESITSLYLRFNSLSLKTQSLILQGAEQFLERLLRLFEKKPECKVSISPNNIYVLSEGGKFRDPAQFVLIDPGPTPNKNYENFNFRKYWNEVLPDRIRKYRQTGYLQWLVPRQVTQSERDEAKEFDIFRGLKPAEIFLLLKIARTVEFDAEEVVVREGAIGENFYLILEGEVELRKGHYSKPGAWIPRLGRGSVIGEMGFLLKVPRSMTVAAATPCRLIEIECDRFHELLDANLTAPYKLLRNIATILAERLHILDNSYQALLESQHVSIREEIPV